jgi:hypothetical protein
MLFKSVVAALSGGPYYVRLDRSRLTIRDAARGGYFDDEPLIALTETDPVRVKVVGSAALVVFFGG